MKALKFISITLLLCCILCGYGFAQQARLVTIPNSNHLQMHSKLAGNNYDIYIHYPAGYDTAKRKFPVLYVVDGDNDFSPSLEYLGLLMAEYHIPEPILVAIGDGGLIGTPGNKRNRDFTPTKNPATPESGGAPAFLAFIEKELIPTIDVDLKTDTANRTLYGYSMGGLFATYTLFMQPSLFKNILIGSPALGYDNGSVFDIEKSYFAKHKSLPVNVFIEVGGLETPGQVVPNKQLVALLDERNYQKLVFKHIIIDNVTHLSGKPVTMLKALQWAYTGK
ncbi:alpha/beta hydrolase [Mucilaginibacter ginsenosidivorax]|nr:alpha/beta hydrolase-fold protein [Mucilaginibacter ginsenosidivorax]